MKVKRLLPILLLALAFPLAAFGAGPEDPYYRQWAQFKVGSNVTLTGTAMEPQGKSSFKQTISLKGVKSDHIILQINRREGSQRTDKPKRVDRFIDNKSKLADLGQEEITVAGKRYACRKYKLTHFYDSGQESIAFTYWFHPDIPGAAQIYGQAKDPKTKEISTVTQTAVSWEKR